MPGYSLFYATGASDPTGDLVTFFNAIKTQFPSPLTWTIPPGGDTLDDATGAINGVWSGAGAGIVSATVGSPWAAGTGAWAAWRTGTIVGRRRLIGRTFLCPLLVNAYDSTGTIGSANLAVLSPAVSALATAGKLVIWHRPTVASPSSGSSSLIISGTVPDQVTSLRSRRY
jgi:hypothetical protein